MQTIDTDIRPISDLRNKFAEIADYVQNGNTVRVTTLLSLTNHRPLTTSHLSLIRPLAILVQVVLERLSQHLVSAGRRIVAREVPVADGVVRQLSG